MKSPLAEDARMCPSQTSLQFWQRYIHCGRGQNVTSSSKCEQTWQSGYIFTSCYELEDELVLPSYRRKGHEKKQMVGEELKGLRF